MIYERMLAERQRLDTEIQKISLQLKQLPPGCLICSRNGNRYKWYHTDGKTQTYIPKKDRAYAEQLAARKYLTLLIFDKQRLYANHGIVPSIQLITTYETNETPLNMELVENMVKFYFE